LLKSRPDFTITAPTAGLGLQRPNPFSASRSAIRIQFEGFKVRGSRFEVQGAEGHEAGTQILP
jgi:hypothetical protein